MSGTRETFVLKDMLLSGDRKFRMFAKWKAKGTLLVILVRKRFPSLELSLACIVR
jgi:hypothetical protein